MTYNFSLKREKKEFLEFHNRIQIPPKGVIFWGGFMCDFLGDFLGVIFWGIFRCDFLEDFFGGIFLWDF